MFTFLYVINLEEAFLCQILRNLFRVGKPIFRSMGTSRNVYKSERNRRVAL
jgi:hypothetical protein